VDRAKVELDDIFCDALEISSHQERAAYLDRACGNDVQLRRRIERLLVAHAEAPSFLAVTPSDVAATGEWQGESPGTLIGPYKLLEPIGEGGFGIVYMAEQQQPIRRKVALKVLKPGMDTRQVVARFEAERQALALMDHPHIAHVFDGGETESGRPYFVMELVKGIPITQYCDEAQLTTRERLELFVHVCQAVQHAHQKGIIHRDIKPSNVLITVQDGVPQVKIIDFGIAKALGQQLTDKTLHTGFAQMIGTPLYMSPEQAALSNVDVDTRSDVYSLGVLLYELLTGTTPFVKERLERMGYDELRRIIREEEPPRPSTRISTLGQASTTISAQRQSDPRRLSRQFRGELDWIVMKALEKDRNRRYETTNSFAADVQQYLRDEPVQACPPSTLYRLRKFARRNKVGLATTAVVASALILGVAISLWQVQRAFRAETQEGLQRTLAQQQESAAQHSRYVAHMILAQQAWQRRDIRTVLKHLNAEHRGPGQPDLRSIGWYYLWRKCHGDYWLSFQDHARSVTGVAFSPDGKTLATANMDRIVKLWDISTGRELASFTGHTNGVRCVAFSPDGATLATSSDDGTVRIWDRATGKPRARLDGHKARIRCVVFSPDGKMLASGGETIKLWDLSTGHERATFTGHTDEIEQVSFSRDGKLLASCSLDSTVRLWDLATGQERVVLRGHADQVYGVAFAPKGGVLASAGVDRTVRFWDIASGQEQEILRGHTALVRSVAFSPDGASLVSTGGDMTVKVWDVATRQSRCTLVGHTDQVLSMALSPDGTLLATGSQDTTVKLWSLARRYNPVLLGHTAGAYSVAFSPDGKTLASGSWDKLVKLWDIGSGRVEATLSGHTIGVLTVAFSPDGKTLATAGDSQIRLWDWATRRLRRTLRGHTSAIQRVAFSRDGSTLASCGDDLTVRLWDTVSGNELATLRGHTAEVDCVAFSPEGRTLASSSRDATVRLWDLTLPGELAVLKGHAGSVRTVTFSPDGKTLANGTAQSTILLWNVATRELRATLMGHTGYVQALAFSPDSSTLVSGSYDGTAKLWDLTTGLEYDTFKEHTDPVDGIALSPNGKTLATASRDQTIRLWDITPATEEEIGAYDRLVSQPSRVPPNNQVTALDHRR
jgi:WD40 repeat protein/serine/threonine protein kinase